MKKENKGRDFLESVIWCGLWNMYAFTMRKIQKGIEPDLKDVFREIDKEMAYILNEGVKKLEKVPTR